MMSARVMADYCAACIYDLTFTGQLVTITLSRQIAIDEAGVVTIRNKTDLLRLRFLSYCERMLSGYFTDFRFRHLTQRKHRARKLRLCQLP